MVITNDTLARTGGHMATSTDSTVSLGQTALLASHGDDDKAHNEAVAKAARDAEAAKLELLKKDPMAYYKQYAPDSTKPGYGQATAVSLPTAPTQAPTAQGTTMQPAATSGTKQLSPATTKPPQPTATTITPQKQ